MTTLKVFFVTIFFNFAIGSNALAQFTFQEPSPNIFNFQRTGLEPLASEAACSSNEPRMQQATFVKFADQESHYSYGDDGSKTCIWGACLNKGETGQSPTNNCSNGFQRQEIKWFGDRDVRNDRDSFLSNEEGLALSSVGRIMCNSVGKARKNNDGSIAKDSNGLPIIDQVSTYSTGAQIGSRSSVTTVAHIFTEEKIDLKTKKVIRVPLSDVESKCYFLIKNHATGASERIPIGYVKSRWDEPGKFNDRSNDLAIIKLTRLSKIPRSALIAGRALLSSAAPTNVTMVGYHNDVNSPEIIRKTVGQIYKAGPELFHEKNAKELGGSFNSSNVFVGNYAANHGSSGSPVFDAQGKIIGIQQGHRDRSLPNGESDRVFDRDENYNLGVLFDDKYFKDLEDLNKQPLPADLI